MEIMPVVEHQEERGICYGETFKFGTQSLSTSGQYTEAFTSQYGCDSVVVLNLIVEELDAGISFDGKKIIRAFNHTD